ncbi:MAG: precorrin-4 C(11)-methyltransferase [Prevotellaceae bacterium]|jgi:precorrin-4 C11-methyltransferase|nr:precorrin-4 C(11)-methyltransferase [Prevotellaceae bacterium]
MKKNAIILISERGAPTAEILKKELEGAELYSLPDINASAIRISSVEQCVSELFHRVDALVFVGALGICVRSIAPSIRDKHTDPAVVAIDSTGKFVISVLSGHVGGANELAQRLARATGGEAIITTQSDNANLWALDTLGKKYGWETETNAAGFNAPIAAFVNGKPTALLLDIKDSGTDYMERTKPDHADVYYEYSAIDTTKYELLIAVTPYLHPEVGIQTIYYRPKVLHLGTGCRRNCDPEGVIEYIESVAAEKGIAFSSIRDISTIDLKKDEKLTERMRTHYGDMPIRIYAAEELKDIEVANPSERVEAATSLKGVSEAAAIKSADNGLLILEKQKGALSRGNEFTFAVAIERSALRRRGHIEIVGAGPGDPDLISVRGRRFVETADLILYAGSLVPAELTGSAKQGAVVRSSASMDLEEQFKLMKEFYDRGELVVRLHTGDPCIYGAIQEQMAYFDAHSMSYNITPGISSFQAAAAALRSQFTIPEKVQTIILTRAEGRTPMPEKEKLHLLARSQSTICIFLSAAIAGKVQAELLEHYPPETPVAVCYRLTWKDERIYRGQLSELAAIITNNSLSLTTMIVVGEAIDNRRGLSKLYSAQFKHLFRP